MRFHRETSHGKVSPSASRRRACAHSTSRARRRIHRPGRGARDGRRQRCGRPAARRPPAARGARVHPRSHPRGGRRRRAVHGQQPDRHGLGEQTGEQRSPPGELGTRLRGQLRRGVRDRCLGLPLEAVHRRRRAGRSGRTLDRFREDEPGLRPGHRARVALQRACVLAVWLTYGAHTTADKISRSSRRSLRSSPSASSTWSRTCTSSRSRCSSRRTAGRWTRPPACPTSAG